MGSIQVKKVPCFSRIWENKNLDYNQQRMEQDVTSAANVQKISDLIQKQEKIKINDAEGCMVSINN